MKTLKIVLLTVFLAFLVQGCVPNQQLSNKNVVNKLTNVKSGQVWAGQYTCVQGKTNLVLRINSVIGNRVNAVFDFNYLNRKKGAFIVNGVYYTNQNRLILKPTKWLKRPSGYVAVGMDGQIRGNQYFGRITDRGCKDFRLQLVK